MVWPNFKISKISPKVFFCVSWNFNQFHIKYDTKTNCYSVIFGSRGLEITSRGITWYGQASKLFQTWIFVFIEILLQQKTNKLSKIWYMKTRTQFQGYNLAWPSFKISKIFPRVIFCISRNFTQFYINYDTTIQKLMTVMLISVLKD